MATATTKADAPAPAPAPSADASPPYVLDAVNNARAQAGKRAMSKEDADKALVDRAKDSTDSEAQFLVALP